MFIPSYINQVLVVVIVLSISFLTTWVFSSDRKSKLNKFFSAWSILSLLWIVFGYYANFTTKTELALDFMQLRFGMVSLFYIFAYFFSCFLYYKKGIHLILDNAIIIICVIFFILSTCTNLIIRDIFFTGAGTEVVFGKLALFFFATISFLTFLVTVSVIKWYIYSLREDRLKIQYFLIGGIIFIAINLIFNVGFPLAGTYRYYQIGDYSAIFLIAFTAYAIVKRELFGIKVVLTSLLIGAIGIVLVLQILIAPSFLWRIVDVVIFLLFCLFGYYLLRAVQQEEKRREEAEMLAIREMAFRQKAEKLAAEFKRLDEAKTQFMLATQHHLRTPLTSIQGYLSMLLEGSYGKISDRAKPKIKNALVATQRLIKLANEFLDVAQFEVGKETMTKKEVQIEEVFDEVVDELKTIARERNLYVRLAPAPESSAFKGEDEQEFSRAFGAGFQPQEQIEFQSSERGGFKKPEGLLPKVMANREKLKEAIYNVVFNGIKYTERGGVIIKLEIANGKLQIVITDTGIGMEPEEIAGLFAKTFERGEEAKKLYTTGRGIGLYLAYQIIKAHGGRLWAESEGRGKGSTFYIELPIN